MVTSRYALHEEGEGSPFTGSLFCCLERASTQGVDGYFVACGFCIASQQNCRKSWIKVMPHDKLRTPRCSPPPAPLSCVMTKTPEPWS